MPKPLREPPPTSSVARFLDPDAASRAMATPSLRPDGPSPQPPQHSHTCLTGLSRSPTNIAIGQLRDELRTLKREFILCPDTDETCSQLVALLRRSTASRLSSSHVIRALLKGVAACMESLDHEAGKIGRLKLPSNALGREQERKLFEQRIAEALINGIRSAAAYRWREPDGGA